VVEPDEHAAVAAMQASFEGSLGTHDVQPPAFLADDFVQTAHDEKG
jgi:hypothetical protein